MCRPVETSILLPFIAPRLSRKIHELRVLFGSENMPNILIPIDGQALSGKSSGDESNVTSESKPVEKTLEAAVWAGTTNLSGYISVKTTVLAEDSAVSRMVRLVEEAQNQHSHIEQLVERVAKLYTPRCSIRTARS